MSAEHRRSSEPQETTPLKVYDAPYSYRGYYDQKPEGQAHVRMFQQPNQPPVLVITDLPENASTSVTNLMECLVLEILHDTHKMQWLEATERPIVIEHLPAINPKDHQGRLSEYRRNDAYSQATFADWKPKTSWIGGRERLSLGEPAWRHMSREEVVKLIGEDEAPPPNALRQAPDEYLESPYEDAQSGDLDR